jgi:hypothetical protein
VTGWERRHGAAGPPPPRTTEHQRSCRTRPGDGKTLAAVPLLQQQQALQDVERDAQLAVQLRHGAPAAHDCLHSAVGKAPTGELTVRADVAERTTGVGICGQ